MALLRPDLPPGPIYGVLAEYDSPHALYAACVRVREEGYTRWDAFSPFPIHGIDAAMGLRRSKIPWLVFACGMVGAAGAMLLQGWTSAVDYPLVISGKPFFSWPAFVPITFELGVLAAAAAAFFGMLACNQLPTLHHPVFYSRRFERATDDRFFVWIESWDPKFDATRTQAFLASLGAVHVELVGAERCPAERRP